MDISQKIFIQSERNLVWRAWIEADRITQWFAPAAEIEPKINGKFELYLLSSLKSNIESDKGILYYQ
ncbi:MAG: SRPBCC domain-containing protein [Bacillota bacterium]